MQVTSEGEAPSVIAGFQLTNASYADSVHLLKERFGELYKQNDAHMRALIDLPVPSNTPSTGHEFHDAIESHIQSNGLKLPSSYGSLHITILLIWQELMANESGQSLNYKHLSVTSVHP